MAANFYQLTPAEVNELYKGLTLGPIQLIVWQKGDPKKFYFQTIGFNHFRKIISLNSKDDFKALIDKDILINFIQGGVIYFMTSMIKKSLGQEQFTVSLDTKIFKCDRRKNFRLEASSFHELSFHIHTKELFPDVPQNVVAINKESAQETEIFKKYVKFLNENKRILKDDVIEFHIQNISVSGLAFYVGSLEANFLKKDHNFKNFELFFNKEKYIVSRATIVYVLPVEDDNRKNIPLFKVGIHFSEIAHDIEEKLARQINFELQKLGVDVDFEDFIT